MCLYYCPFCSSRYQCHKTRNNGVLICAQCGELLIPKSLLNSKRIIGVVAVFAFLVPLLIMLIFIVKEFTEEKHPINTNSLVLLTIDKSWII